MKLMLMSLVLGMLMLVSSVCTGQHIRMTSAGPDQAGWVGLNNNKICGTPTSCQDFHHGKTEGCWFCSGTTVESRCSVHVGAQCNSAASACGNKQDCQPIVDHDAECNWATTGCDWNNCTDSGGACTDTRC
jgi:hypothetical protein